MLINKFALLILQVEFLGKFYGTRNIQISI